MVSKNLFQYCSSLSSIEMRSKLCVILLAGIFALQVITMVLLVLK